MIGYDDSGVMMNDSYGSCDLVNGGYPQNHNGARQHYSYNNWEPRWRPQGSGSGISPDGREGPQGLQDQSPRSRNREPALITGPIGARASESPSVVLAQPCRSTTITSPCCRGGF